MKKNHVRVKTGDNIFGYWKIDMWAPDPPIAPTPSYVLRWKTRDSSEAGYSIHRTLADAVAAVPFSTEVIPSGNITAAR